MGAPSSQITISFDDSKVKLGIRNLATGLPSAMESEMTPLMEQAKFEASGGYQGGNSYTVPTTYGQTYQRTGNLGRSLYLERSGLTYRMINTATSPAGEFYGVKVLGNAAGGGQGRDFMGRWPLMAQVMVKWAGIAIERMRSKIDAMVIDFGL